jgi:hypothetical protein|tara:strand:+ start:5438 stop:5902 length:465 start_codon:yes stop_codon:yes gene_type:complete
MVDENLDPRTVDSMRRFAEYSDDSTKNMNRLRDELSGFNRIMNVSHTRTRDLREALRQMQSIEPMRNVQGVLEEAQQTAFRPPQQTDALPQNQPAGSVEQNQNVNIGAIKIDVSGITDRSDKKKLAEELGAMVSKQLRSKMGGSLQNSGVSRGI